MWKQLILQVFFLYKTKGENSWLGISFWTNFQHIVPSIWISSMIRSLGFWSLLEPLQLQPRISSIVVEPITKIILGWNQADKGLKDALHFLLCLIIWKIIKHSKRKKSLAHPCSTYFVHDTTGLWVLEYLSTHSSSNLIMLGGEVNNEVPYEIRGLIFITHFFLIFGHDSSMTLDLLHYYMDFVMKKNLADITTPKTWF